MGGAEVSCCRPQRAVSLLRAGRVRGGLGPAPTIACTIGAPDPVWIYFFA